MIDLIIDTSILRTDPHRQKSGFKAISELSKREKINVHIPKIVEQEFLTQEEEYLETAFSEAKKSILNLRKRLGEKHTQHLSKIENLLDDLQIASKNNCKEQFNEWIKNHEIIIGEIHPEHNSRVLDAYFLGAPPFKAKKSRNDIPDAFIFEYIKDLAINRDKAHVIAGDGALRSGCESIASLTTHQTIDSFIKHTDCKTALAELYRADFFVATSKNLDQHKNLLAEIIESLLPNKLFGKVFSSRHISKDSDLARISYTSGCHSIEINTDVATPTSNSVIARFSAQVDCQISYTAPASDVYHDEDDYIGAMYYSNDNSTDEYALLFEDVLLHVEGIFSISIDPEIIPAQGSAINIEELISTDTIYIEKIVSIEIIE